MVFYLTSFLLLALVAAAPANLDERLDFSELSSFYDRLTSDIVGAVTSEYVVASSDVSGVYEAVTSEAVVLFDEVVSVWSAVTAEAGVITSVVVSEYTLATSVAASDFAVATSVVGSLLDDVTSFAGEVYTIIEDTFGDPPVTLAPSGSPGITTTYGSGSEILIIATSVPSNTASTPASITSPPSMITSPPSMTSVATSATSTPSASSTSGALSIYGRGWDAMKVLIGIGGIALGACIAL